MAGPDWLRWALAATFVAVAGYCVARLVAAQRAPARYPGCQRALDVAHLVMAAGMAVMCSPAGGPVPAAGWLTAFLLIAVWFLGAAWHTRRTGGAPGPAGWHGGNLHHAAAALVMIYMITTMPADAHHLAAAWLPAHPGDPALPALAWVLTAYLAAAAAPLAPRAVRTAPGSRELPVLLRTPRVAATCQLAMTLGMAYLVAPVG